MFEQDSKSCLTAVCCEHIIGMRLQDSLYQCQCGRVIVHCPDSKKGL